MAKATTPRSRAFRTTACQEAIPAKTIVDMSTEPKKRAIAPIPTGRLLTCDSYQIWCAAEDFIRTTNKTEDASCIGSSCVDGSRDRADF